MLGASNTSLRLVDNKETSGIYERRQGYNGPQGDIATNSEMLPSGPKIIYGRLIDGRLIVTREREERHISQRENRYFEKVSVPGEEHPQKRCRSCGWTSSSPRCDPRQSQATLDLLGTRNIASEREITQTGYSNVLQSICRYRGLRSNSNGHYVSNAYTCEDNC
jgi:hypothetical protein